MPLETARNLRCQALFCVARLEPPSSHCFSLLYHHVCCTALLALNSGATPRCTAVSRAMVVSMTQLGTYDQAKTALAPILGDNKVTHLASAVTAAVVYSFASLPLVRSQDQALVSCVCPG